MHNPDPEWERRALRAAGIEVEPTYEELQERIADLEAHRDGLINERSVCSVCNHVRLFENLSTPCPHCVIDSMREENSRVRELKETLLDVLTQACIFYEEQKLFDTGALSAYRDGWELAVELGFAEREGELVGRRGFYRPKWDALDDD